MSSFDSLGLSDRVMTVVRLLGYEKPTPIQAQAIPAVLAGRDVIGASQTGTGKTAAFGLPILSRMEPAKHPTCLVLEPTRELAAQVYEAMRQMGKFTHNRFVLLHGGVSYNEQIEALEGGANVILATPGRLLDHISRGTMSMDGVKYVVLDETDRMLDMGFLPDVRKIVEKCPREGRQTMLFSATMPPQIETLANWALKDPVEIEIGQRRSVPDTVNHAFYPVSIDQRDELILELLRRTDFSSVMVFTRTKREADMLMNLVSSENHRVTVMHSDIPQNKREQALRGFREGEYDVIIATDVAARGLDISGVSHVINYRVPENAEDYVHRIGRTGRAESEGDAFTLLSADELDYARSVERFIEKKIERRKLDNFNYIYSAILDEDAPPKPVRRKAPKGRPRSRR